LFNGQKNGDETTVSRIDETGEIYFELQIYDIVALGRTHFPSNLEGQFNMIGCKGKGEYKITGEPVFKTPYDEVYSQMYAPMNVRKYGVVIGYLWPVSEEKMLIKENYNKIIGSKYYWMYIDRALKFKDTCVKKHLKILNLVLSRLQMSNLKKDGIL